MKRNIRLFAIVIGIITIVSGCKKSSTDPSSNGGNGGTSYIDGVFSASKTFKVRFAPGNLQYNMHTDTWKFADNQWDVLGDSFNPFSYSFDGWMDLFGYGTGNNPTNFSTDYHDYMSFSDWGRNTISNSNYNNWRTLTNEQWRHIFFFRATPSGTRFAKAIVNGHYGVILLPDEWENEIYSLNRINDYNGAHWGDNNISKSDWENILEPNGAVFLPCGGRREEMEVSSVNYHGFYWSKDSYNIENGKCVLISFRSLDFTYTNIKKYHGCSVRLVRPNTD